MSLDTYLGELFKYEKEREKDILIGRIIGIDFNKQELNIINKKEKMGIIKYSDKNSIKDYFVITSHHEKKSLEEFVKAF